MSFRAFRYDCGSLCPSDALSAFTLPNEPTGGDDYQLKVLPKT
jgi:hypothetical protein